MSENSNQSWSRAVISVLAIYLGAVFSVARADVVLVSLDAYGQHVYAIDTETGTNLGQFTSGGPSFTPRGLTFDHGGNLLVANVAAGVSGIPGESDSILRYDGQTGAFLGVFSSGPLIQSPHGMTYGPDGNLYVANLDADNILRVDSLTGNVLGVFATGGGLDTPYDLAFGPDGNLYVSSGSFATSKILRFDGTSGAYIDDFATGGGLSLPVGMRFGPDSNLYVAGYGNHAVLRYDGTSGSFLDVFASHPQLGEAYGIVFDSEGDLLVGSYFMPEGVTRFDGSSGSFAEFYPIGAPPLNPTFLAVMPFAVPEPGSAITMALVAVAWAGVRGRRCKK